MSGFSSDPPLPAECPRCGYDLRGETSRWTSACPVRGVCVECGFAFAWVEIFTHSRHPWLFETEWRHLPLRRLTLTVLHAFRPSRFWRGVRLTDPVRLCPAGVIAGSILLAFLVAAVAWTAYRHHDFFATYGRPKLARVTGFYWPDRILDALPKTLAELVMLLPAPLILLMGMPLAFLMIPTTLRRARIRRAHVLRIWIYSMILPVTVAMAWTAFELGAHLGKLETVADVLNPWTWADDLSLRGHQTLWEATVYCFRYSLPSMGIGVLTAIWLGVWWRCACRRYLDLPTPGRVTLVLLVVVCFAAIVAQIWIDLVHAF